MKIAYVLYPEAIVINKSNGIRNQALKWRDALYGLADVELISPWQAIDWKKYDIIHFFGGTQWLGFVPDLRRLNDNVVFSPVWDSVDSQQKLRRLAAAGWKGYHHPWNMYRQYLHSFKGIFVRSDYEAEYMSYSFKVPDDCLHYAPIGYEIQIEDKDVMEKEDFCLHVSALYQERKNVHRLVEAALQGNFRLVLCGNTGNESQRHEIEFWAQGSPLIDIKGFVSADELKRLYEKAKVFALPSLNEGVGIVALNAAVAGCEVVLTQIGGPKEYFGGMAHLVNPFDVGDIANAVSKAMSMKSTGKLRSYITEKYSPQAIGYTLLNCYKQIMAKI